MRAQTINRISFLLLVTGLGAALLVFLTAEPTTVDPLLGDYRASKRYQRELKMMGGEANVLVDEFQEWFANQWQGRTLARTLIVLTVGSTLLFRLVASHPDYAEPTENHHSDV